MRFGSTLLTLFTFSISIQSSVSASPIPLTQDGALELVTVLPTTQCDSSECIDWDTLAGKTRSGILVETTLTEDDQTPLETICIGCDTIDELPRWQVLFESLVSITTQSLDFITRPVQTVLYNTVGFFHKVEAGSPMDEMLRKNEGADMFL